MSFYLFYLGAQVLDSFSLTWTADSRGGFVAVLAKCGDSSTSLGMTTSESGGDKKQIPPLRCGMTRDCCGDGNVAGMTKILWRYSKETVAVLAKCGFLGFVRNDTSEVGGGDKKQIPPLRCGMTGCCPTFLDEKIAAVGNRMK